MENTENTEKTTNQKNDTDPLPKPSNDYRRTVKTYVMRAGRMTAAQERSYKELSPAWCIPFENKKLNFIDVFGNTNPIIVEIGFGMGDATVKIAQAHPDINYLGIEVHRPGVGKILSEIKKRELKNLFVIEYDALDVLEYMIGDNSVNGFHIFFPDPWPKKRHHKRRLVQRPKTDLLAQKLAPDGYIYFVTDIIDYAEFALEQLTDTPHLKNKYEGFAEPQDWRVSTKFERKGIAADRQITELFFEKKEE
ncbi:MAG: tRNA (guanosine(46)-N7)-methyltransferase TrmB [Treponema sp.]|nr:tRNA (guanosine(46)-N7)-methyltransferase TrmB [Treponema sp.]